MFSFDLPFDEIPIVLGTEEVPVYAKGVAHCIGDWDGASVVDITLAFERDGATRERMLNRDNPVEQALYRLLAASVERKCAHQFDEIIDERCGAAIAKAHAADRAFYQWQAGT
jgi:hypothetical protein